MASAAAELFVKVTADTKGLTDGMDDAARAIDHLGEEAKKAEQPLVRFRDIVAGSAVGELLADGIRSAASAMVNMGTQSIKLAGELEQNKVAFTTMLKSAEAADKMLKDLAAFAANTPFELRGLTDSAKKLLAFGFQSESIIPIMTALGDAIGGVGGGQEAIGQVTMALGQMAAKGKVSAEEMNQFAEKGINTWKYVADAIGKSVPEAMKLAEKGAIDAATAIPAILEGMSKEFGGMMKKQSQTWNGALSNFQDSTDQAMTKIGTAIINMGIGDLLRTMTIGINNVAAAFESGAIIPILDGIKAAAIGTAAAFTAYLVPSAIASGGSIAAAFSTAALAAAPFIALAAAVAFAAYPIIKNWQEIKWALEDVFNAGSQVITDFYNRGARIAADLANNFTKAFTWIGSNIRRVLGDELTNKLIGGMKAGGEAALSFAEKVSPALFVIRRLPEATANFKETWGDAMTSARNLTTGLFTETKTISPEIKKITAELLGLKKAGATADQLAAAQKKLEAAQRAAEVAARKHAAEMERQTRINEQAYTKFESMAMALETVGAAMRKAEAEAQKVGRGFDLAGAKADAIKSGLSSVESAFGKFSPQANTLREQMFYLRQESENGGAAFASSAKIIDEATKELETAREVARVLGKEFNHLEVALGIAENAMKKLIEKGLKPGNKEYDEQLKKLQDLQTQQKNMPQSIYQIASAAGDLTKAFKDTITGLFDVASMIGIEVPQAVKVGAAALVAGAGAIIGFTLATEALTVAWGKFTVAFASNPVGAALVIAGAAVVGILSAVAAARKTEGEAMAQAKQNAKDTMQTYEEFSVLLSENEQDLKDLEERARKTMSESLTGALGSALKEGIIAFTEGAQNYAEILRDKINQAMFDAIVDQLKADMIKRVLKPMTDEIVEAYFQGNYEGMRIMFQNLKDETVKAATSLGEIAGEWKKTVAAGSEELTRMANKTIDAANNLREQNSLSLSRLYGQLSGDLTPQQREALLAQARILQGRPQSGDEALARGMALGGLVTGPTFARLGEGGRDEAVLPLNDRVYSSIAEGIAGAGASGTQVVINYTGNGKWTREDAQGLGRLLVAELRSMGVRA